MAHKILNKQHVSTRSEFFPLQLLRHLVKDVVHFDCLKRWTLSSLDTAQSWASKLTTHNNESLLTRRACNTSRHFSFWGWRSFFAMTFAKFIFGLDSVLEPSTEVTNAVNVVIATVWMWTTLAFTEVESPIAPMVIKLTKQNKNRIKICSTALVQLN